MVSYQKARIQESPKVGGMSKEGGLYGGVSCLQKQVCWEGEADLI